MNNTINLPCNIGDKIYVVEDYNSFYDKCEYYETVFGTKIVIKGYIVEVFVVDESGVSIGEHTHDGINKLDTYHHLYHVEDEDCKIFYCEKDAMDFVKSISV